MTNSCVTVHVPIIVVGSVTSAWTGKTLLAWTVTALSSGETSIAYSIGPVSKSGSPVFMTSREANFPTSGMVSTGSSGMPAFQPANGILLETDAVKSPKSCWLIITETTLRFTGSLMDSMYGAIFA